MTFGWRRTFLGATVTSLVCLLGLVSAAGQAPGQDAQMAENVFKNVQVLKGIPADEFMDAMGMFSASLGYDCVSCHSPNIYNDRVNGFAETTPTIQRARQMVLMMNAMNRTYFAGEQRLTCFTCHRGQVTPANIPSLALQYGEVPFDPNDISIFPEDRTTVDQVWDTYMQALGGAERVASLTSFVATGMYSGFNTGGGPVPVEIFARAPNQRTQVVRMPEGEGIKTFDGMNAWAAEGWRPAPLLALTGGNREGAELEALLGFPAQLRGAFSQWQVSSTLIDDRPVQILQGFNEGELPVNLYFNEAGLLMRVMRWNRTSVGIVPTQFDLTDYRDVAGVQMPFHILVTWTDGQNTYELKDVQPNVAIDASRFARPAPFGR